MNALRKVLYHLLFSLIARGRSLPHALQVLAYDTPSSPVEWEFSRYLFAETGNDEHNEARRFLALDYRGGVAGENGASGEATKWRPGWVLGKGSDGNGALGLGQDADLSR